MQFSNHDVVIAGGGPTGLMLAGELALAGVDVALVERRPDQSVEGSRASGLHPRSLELLDQRGIVDRFIEQGEKHHVVAFAGTILDASDRPTRHNYTLGLWQAKIERGLADWVTELGVPILYDCEVTGFAQDADGVDVALHDGRSMGAAYLVGCDGGRSLVRGQAGIDFAGWDADISYLIFEGEMADEPAWGIRHGDKGLYALGKLEDGRVRGVVTEPERVRGPAPDLGALRTALVAAYGGDFGVHGVTWLSRFTDAARQATAYRAGRVLLAGDAAHVHSPVGGQGLNIGLQDAVNLGWKLALAVKGLAVDALLDSYHSERHPVGAALLQQTLALTALNRGDARSSALRAMMAETMQMDEPRRQYAATMSALDVRYDMGQGHELLGRRVPDLDLITADGPARLFAMMHDAKPLLVNFGEAGRVDPGEYAAHVRCIDAQAEGVCELPRAGVVALPEAMLVRPDGHVAWTGDATADGLAPVLQGWFGAPG